MDRLFFWIKSHAFQVIRKHHKKSEKHWGPTTEWGWKGGWGWNGGWGGPHQVSSKLDQNYTSPPNFIQIRLKLPKFLIHGGFRVVGLNMNRTLCVPFCTADHILNLVDY